MRKRPARSLLAVTLAAAMPAATAAAPARVRVEGYAEWLSGWNLLVDGQRIRLAADGRFDGRGAARSVEDIPLGHEVSGEGRRLPDGTILADRLEARPNGLALFEKQLDRLVPPYLEPERVRPYVIENDEWNAFAMGNYSIYVFSGLLKDLDDDELAVVLGHELWKRFAGKYGEPGRVANFFFANHSRASARAVHLEREIALNHPADAQGVRAARSTPRRFTEPAAGRDGPRASKETAALVSPGGDPPLTRVKVGMSPEQVRRLLGAPDKEVAFGPRTYWTYGASSVVFEDGKVVEVRF